MNSRTEGEISEDSHGTVDNNGSENRGDDDTVDPVVHHRGCSGKIGGDRRF